MPPQPRIEQESHGAHTVLRVTGEIDLASCEQLGDALTEALPAAGFRLVIDASGIGFIDSVGLRTLLHAARQASDHDGRLVLAAPSEAVAHVVSLTGMDSFLPSRDTLGAALDMLDRPPS